ncbi:MULTISPECIES: hypothetical protein [Pseudomonas]|uniref:Uncharacterized protein n=1 Tax=Pseudomonas luteola TaxID=47886 RepID=A0ABS0FTN0_PSELU|nr:MULTISPECIES: hypothetical protein [Pseudomonas]MBF8643704.1 hypothetical protein [Pseudomonas zeshuii]MBW5414922.1 hypothetical protein [Pseudomonas sp. MAG002Y]
MSYPTIMLFHVTSIERARSIIASQQFKPADHAPHLSDSGLNAGIVGELLASQQYEHYGAKLIMEWSGPVINGAISDNPFPLPIDTLYNALPWRVVVSQGTTQYLRAVDIQCSDQALMEDARHPWYCLTEGMQERWRLSELKKRRDSIKRLVKDKPSICVKP